MRFSAPTGLVFLIALVVAVIAALEAMGTISFVPLASVWIMAIAYAVLAVAASSRASDYAGVRLGRRTKIASATMHSAAEMK